MGTTYSCDICNHPDKEDTHRCQYLLKYFQIIRSDIEGVTEYTTFTPSPRFVQLVQSRENKFTAILNEFGREEQMEICKQCFEEILNVPMKEKTSYFVFDIQEKMYFMSIWYTEGSFKHK